MNIIIIDDELDTHTFLNWYLTAEGYKVHSAYNGFEGLKLVDEQEADLIILDVMLPVLGGWEVCERIRNFSDVPIVMISAVASHEQDILHGLDIGANDYLTKPLQLDTLRSHIDTLLQGGSVGP